MLGWLWQGKDDFQLRAQRNDLFETSPQSIKSFTRSQRTALVKINGLFCMFHQLLLSLIIITCDVAMVSLCVRVFVMIFIL